MKHTVFIYRDEEGEWRWRRLATQGSWADQHSYLVFSADSGEGYATRNAAIAAATVMNTDKYTLNVEDLVEFSTEDA